MRAYKAKISNAADDDSGAIWTYIIVFADDALGAMMSATDFIEVLREELKSLGMPQDAYTTLEVDDLELVCQVVGKVGLVYSDEDRKTEDNVKEWAKRLATKTKKDMNK